METLKYEVSKLLIGKNMKTFKFSESIKKIEKSILKTVSNYGEIKYEPVQMDKINNLLSYNNTNLSNNQEKIPSKNKLNKFAPKIEEERKNQDYSNQPRIQSAIPKVNKLSLNNKNNTKKNSNEIPYPTEKMEKLREREKNKWAIQINKEYEEYLKEQDKLKKDNYEKKLQQRKFLEEQIKQKKEYQNKMKQEEKNIQPYFTSLKFEEKNINNPGINNKEKENNKRPLSSKPMVKRRKEEIEYQKKIEEDLKKYQEQENMKKKMIRDKLKENIKNKILKTEETNKNKINQNIKHQMAINNYENQKYKKEIEQEQKKLINDELIQNEKKMKMINDFKKGLDDQIKEKQKLKELNKEKIMNENKDNLNIKNQIIEENNMRNKVKYERINNYKKDLDEQIEQNKKLKQNIE